MEKIKFFFKHKYVKLFLLLAALVISLRPLVFTWNFLHANFHLKNDKTEAGAYIAGAVSAKSSVYKVFNKYAPMALEQYLVKFAIYNNAKERLTAYSPLIPLERIQTQFKDNFYIGYLLGSSNEKGDWWNLDEVSFDLLSDPRMNPRTMAALEKIRSTLDKAFLKNLADFVSWQNNRPLVESLVSSGEIETPPFSGAKLEGRDYDQSVERLKKVMWQKYKLKGEWLGENVLQCPGYAEESCVAAAWYFSKMAGEKNFSRGSFFMGSDYMGKSKNPAVRIMGFFVAEDPGKTKPRAGIRSRQSITAENGFYVFSFDYCTVTGKESPSFWLGKKMEKRLPHTRRQWKKVILILNNAFNQYEILNPLIRMWGTGTLLLDNVFLAKTAPLKFSIDGAYEMHIDQLVQE